MGHTSPFNPFGPDTSSPEGAASVAPGACTASGLRVVLDVAAPVGGVRFALQRSAHTAAAVADTAVLCTVPAGATSCTSGAAAAAISAGDILVFRSDTVGALPIDVNIYFGWVCQ
jgi:hypothetical protein